MDFSPPSHLEPILQTARTLVEELAPLEARMHEGFFKLGPQLQRVRASAKERGLWLPQIPKDAGGMGLSVLEHGLLTEVLGRSPLGHYSVNCQAPDAGNMEILLEFGTPHQKETFLAPLLAGETRSCFGMTEPGRAGSNPVWLETKAVRDGDDYVLDGHKWFTSSADGAAFVIVMAVTEPEAGPHERASMLIVPTDTPGYENVRNIPVMGDVGEGWPSHSEVRFTGCRVPAQNLLGARRQGLRHRSGAAGAGADPPLHAVDGDLCPVAGDDGGPRGRRESSRAGDVLGNRQDDPELDRGEPGRDRGGAAARAAGGVDDRQRWGQGGARGDLDDQVLRERRADAGGRPRDPGARGRPG